MLFVTDFVIYCFEILVLYSKVGLLILVKPIPLFSGNLNQFLHNNGRHPEPDPPPPHRSGKISLKKLVGLRYVTLQNIQGLNTKCTCS